MFTRMPDDYYDETSMYPERPMIRSAERMPGHEGTQNIMQGFQPGLPGTADFQKEPGPPVFQGANYSQGWLIKQLGKYIKVEFLIGTSMLIDREGILIEVGVNYIVLKESGTKDDLMCDMYSIKFVRVFDEQEKAIICK